MDIPRTPPFVDTTMVNPDIPPVPVNGDQRRMNYGLAFVPFTPVPFTGETAIMAWARLIVYTAGAALLWNRARRLSYILTGASIVSVGTSLASSRFNERGTP